MSAGKGGRCGGVWFLSLRGSGIHAVSQGQAYEAWEEESDLDKTNSR